MSLYSRIPVLLSACLLLFPTSSPGRPVPSGRTPPANNARVQVSYPSRVSIRVEGDRRIIVSNGIPDHTTGEFPGPGNPNAIMEQNYHFEMPVRPRKAARLTPILGMIFGVAIDGVIFDPGTADYWHNERGSIWHVEGIVNGRRTLGIDWSDAHVQPNGAYHYHGVPWGILEKYHAEKKMFLVGWAADGFPIYGPYAYQDPMDASSPVVEMKSSYRLKTGMRPSGDQGPGGRYDGTYSGDYEYIAGSGNLDRCNGRFGVTPQFPKGTYYYVTTVMYPFVPRFFRGTPDPSFRHPHDRVRHRPAGRRGVL